MSQYIGQKGNVIGYIVRQKSKKGDKKIPKTDIGAAQTSEEAKRKISQCVGDDQGRSEYAHRNLWCSSTVVQMVCKVCTVVKTVCTFVQMVCTVVQTVCTVV